MTYKKIILAALFLILLSNIIGSVHTEEEQTINLESKEIINYINDYLKSNNGSFPYLGERFTLNDVWNLGKFNINEPIILSIDEEAFYLVYNQGISLRMEAIISPKGRAVKITSQALDIIYNDLKIQNLPLAESDAFSLYIKGKIEISYVYEVSNTDRLIMILFFSTILSLAAIYIYRRRKTK